MKAKLISRITVVSLFLSSVAISGLALAQTEPAPVPGHPNVNEVNQRQANQQNRIQNGVADGQINAKQEARDEQHASNISARESHDEAEHGGHLTKGETQRLNHAQNRNSRQIHRQRTHG